tara:strand:+ start:3059 stop:5884 length:2826 start_codon:yes stop_codon:yes gene_type:complete
MLGTVSYKKNTHTGLIKKFLCGTALSLTLLVSACDNAADLTLDERLQRAVEQQSEGNLEAAIIELKNAVNDYPDSVDARFLLGQIFLELENPDAAEIEFEKARENGKDPEALRIPMAKVWVLQGNYQRVLQEIQVEETDSLLTKVNKYIVLGKAHFGLRHMVKAEEYLEQALQLAPNNVEALVSRAEFHYAQKENDKIAALVARAEALVPGDRKLRELKGHYVWAEGDHEQAEKIFAELSRDFPHFGINKLYLAWLQIINGKLERASSALAELRAEYTNNPLVNYVSSLLFLTDKKYNEAKIYAGKALEYNPEDVRALYIAGLATFALKEYEQSYSYISKYSTRLPQDRRAKKMLAQILFNLNRSEEAIATLEPLVEDRADDVQLLNMLAELELRKGKLDQSRIYLERSLEVDKNQPAQQQRLGQLRIATGDVDRGLQDLEAAVANASESYKAKINLVRGYIVSGRYEEAIAVCRALQQEEPENVNGFLCEGVTYLKQGNLGQAETMLKSVLDKDPKNLTSATLLVEIFSSQRKNDEAERYVDLILKHYPDNTLALFSKYIALTLKGQNDDALSYLEQAARTDPTAYQVNLILARTYLKQNRPRDAQVIMKNLLPLYPANTGLLEVDGIARMQLGDYLGAAAAFEKLVSNAPENIKAHLYLAGAYNRSGNWTGLQETARKILALAPDHDIGKAHLAKAYFQQNKWAEADQVLSSVSSDELYVNEVQGQLNLALRNYDKAVKNYQVIFETVPDNASLFNLARAYNLAGQSDKAVALLTRWQEQHPDDLLASSVLGDLYLSRENYSLAIAQYNRVLKHKPDQPAILNNLAWTLYKQGNIDRALERIRRARDIAPGAAYLLDTEAMILQAKGYHKEAVRQLRKAVDLEPRNLEYRFHLAQAIYRDGKIEEALPILEEIQRDGRVFPGHTEAMQLLESIQRDSFQ